MVVSEQQKQRQQIQKPCSCYDTPSIFQIADNILSLEYDIFDITIDCNERTNERGFIENKLYIKDVRSIVTKYREGVDMPEFPIGYGSEVSQKKEDKNGNNNSFCYDHDMIQIISQDEAVHCLKVINEGCTYLKERMCPCFNMQELLSIMMKPPSRNSTTISSPNKNVDHCQENNSTKEFGIIIELFDLTDNNHSTSSDPLYTLDRNSKSVCMRGNDTYDINKDQYTHCLDLISFTCLQYDQY